MRIFIIATAATLALAGCGDNSPSQETGEQAAPNPVVKSAATQAKINPAYQTKIEEIDFFDLAATKELSSKLDPADTYAFLLYAMAWKAAKVSGDDSEVRDANGALPRTVSDIIALQNSVMAKTN